MNVLESIERTFREKAEQPALDCNGGWINWGGVERFAKELEQLLTAAGIAKGARIGMVARSRPSHAAAMLGLLSRGHSISLVYSMLSPTALATEIKRLDASAVLADAQDWPAIQAACAELGTAGIGLRDVPFEPFAVSGLEATRIKSAEYEEQKLEILSSGTTGPPKRLPLPVRVFERAMASATPMDESTPTPHVSVWPLSGVGGLVGISSWGIRGNPLVLIEKFSAQAFAEAIKRHKPSVTAVPPAVIRMVMDAKIPAHYFASLTAIYGGSAKLEPDLQDQFEAEYGVPLYWGMGASEFCGTLATWTPDLRAKFGGSKRGSVGQSLPGISLRIVDPDSGEMVENGRSGLMEVLVPALQPEWVRTTDLISIDADGFIFHHGRHDGAIVRGGFKILPEAIAERLRQFPAVADAAVVGLADARLGEVPAAMVELKANGHADEASLQSFLREHLPATHIPVLILIVSELPRTSSMKVSLGDVREQLRLQRGLIQ